MAFFPFELFATNFQMETAINSCSSPSSSLSSTEYMTRWKSGDESSAARLSVLNVIFRRISSAKRRFFGYWDSATLHSRFMWLNKRKSKLNYKNLQKKTGFTYASLLESGYRVNTSNNVSQWIVSCGHGLWFRVTCGWRRVKVWSIRVWKLNFQEKCFKLGKMFSQSESDNVDLLWLLAFDLQRRSNSL